jgi:ribosomal protein L7/L12
VEALTIAPAPAHDTPAAASASTTHDTAALENQLRPLLRAGRKISAIRLYQERTGVSLREARQVVEQLERESDGASH